jgi:hypothetical protein
MINNNHTYNFDPSILDYEEDNDFFELYSNEGSETINELSRQLRSFFNYKKAVIQLRYSNPQKIEIQPHRKTILEWEEKLASLFSQYVSNLRLLGLKEEILAEKLLSLLEKVKIQPNCSEINILKENKSLTSEIWKIIHILSEYEIYNHPQLLNVVIQIICLLCNAQEVYSSVITEFYRELKQNYLNLRVELSILFHLDGEDQLDSESKKKRVRLKE